MQEDLKNETIFQGEKETTTPLTPLGSFLKRNIKKLLFILAIALLIESLWAINFVKSAKTTKTTNTRKDNSQNSQIPEALTPIATQYFDPETNTVSLGNEFELAIVITTGDRKINGADSAVTYDPNMLTVVDGYTDAPGIQVKPGNIYNSLLINSVDPVEGKITLTGSRLSKETPAFQGTGNFALIRFRATNVGSTEIKLLFDPTSTKTSSVVESETSANILTGTRNALIQITQ